MSKLSHYAFRFAHPQARQCQRRLPAGNLFWWVCGIGWVLAWAEPATATIPTNVVILTSNTTLATNDFQYEGMDLIIEKCTLTVQGDHAFGDIVVTNTGALVQTGEQLWATNLLLIADSTYRLAGGARLSVDQTITLTNQASLTVLSLNNTDRDTNGQWSGRGGRIEAGSVSIASNCVITANGQGYSGGGNPAKGPGAGTSGAQYNDWWGAGGAYGGTGGAGRNNYGWGGSAYGSAWNPSDLGSGGGGGVVTLTLLAARVAGQFISRFRTDCSSMGPSVPTALEGDTVPVAGPEARFGSKPRLSQAPGAFRLKAGMGITAEAEAGAGAWRFILPLQ